MDGVYHCGATALACRDAVLGVRGLSGFDALVFEPMAWLLTGTHLWLSATGRMIATCYQA